MSIDDPVLAGLVARQEITDALHRYAMALDDHDWPALEPIFAPDVVCDLGGGRVLRDRRSMSDLVAEVIGRFDVTHHLVGNVTFLSLEGAEAETRCYLQAWEVRRGVAGGDTFMMAGEYRDRWIRTDRWRIVHRQLLVAATAGNPEVPAAAAAAAAD